MAFDMKEAEDIEEVEDQGLVCDAQARYFCEPDLRKAIPDWREPEEDERTYKEAFPDHLEQIIDEVLDELVFFRFDGKRLPATLKEAVKLVLPWSFFSPSFVWLNGRYYQNISNVENDKGNVNCVRF